MQNGLGQVIIVRQDGGFGLGQGNDDGVCGYITAVPSTAIPVDAANNPTYTLGSTIKLTGLLQAERTYGLNEAYDLTHKVLVWHNLREFFRLGGTELWLMLVDSGIATTQDALVDVANPAFASQLLQDAGGRVRCLGVGYNVTAAPATGVDMAQMSEDAILKAQDLANQEWGLSRPLDVIIEGLNFSQATIQATQSLRTTYKCTDVSVYIGQCGITAAKDVNFGWHALVGTCLGLYGKRQIHESIGWVEKGNIVDLNENIYTDYRTSGGVQVKNIAPADLDALDDFAYIFPRNFNSFNGVYLNNDHSCAETTSDYQYIALNRVLKALVRICYQQLVPHINRAVLVDDATGRLAIGERLNFQEELRSAIEGRLSGNIQAINDLVIDPEFDENNNPYPLFRSDGVLRVLATIVPFGKVEQVRVMVSYSINN